MLIGILERYVKLWVMCKVSRYDVSVFCTYVHIALSLRLCRADGPRQARQPFLNTSIIRARNVQMAQL